jgi:hypothetical protein
METKKETEEAPVFEVYQPKMYVDVVDHQGKVHRLYIDLVV